MEKDEYQFAIEKNAWLKENRNISFDEIIAALEDGRLLSIIEHPNQERYSNQRMFVIDIGGYIHLVPFVRKSENCFFLKTIFKSRKMTKQYLGKKSE